MGSTPSSGLAECKKVGAQTTSRGQELVEPRNHKHRGRCRSSTRLDGHRHVQSKPACEMGEYLEGRNPRTEWWRCAVAVVGGKKRRHLAGWPFANGFGA